MSTRTCLPHWGILLILLFTIPGSGSERNVALAGTAQQSSSASTRWPAEKAIDGCTIQFIGPLPDCCAHTEAKGHNQAWWRVDLGQSITIQYITIYYRNGTSYRFGGYSLYVSNSTTSIRDTLCYQDNSNSFSDVNINPTHHCPYVARYVSVYNYRGNPKRHDWYSDDAVLELCEVQVFGCPIGQFGNGTCDYPCIDSCYGGNCNAITGACFYCFLGKFGEFCEQPCSTNCNNTCEKDTGHCNGCSIGKKGELCNVDCHEFCVICEQYSEQCIVCRNGKYGDTCEFECSDNCKFQSCMKDNGHCLECVDGKFGDFCDLDCSDNCKDKLCLKETGFCQECVQGKHGSNCTDDCPVNCKDNNCTRDNGNCIGCIPGTHGSDCAKICPANCKNNICVKDSGNCIDCDIGYHGDQCDTSCPGNCKSNNCTKTNGQCIGCIPGKRDIFCQSDCTSVCVTCDQTSNECFECANGKYGPSCSMDCPGQCKDNICQQSDGTCTECANGKYGPSCSMDCPGQCKDNICQQSDGTCTECANGKYGPSCSMDCPGQCKDNICQQSDGTCTECADGKHGSSCSLDCPGQCKDSICQQTEGTCTECTIGKYGPFCNKSCSENCLDNTCNINSGTCIDCKDGVFGENCSMQCGNCDQCTRDNGYCISACSSGYEGNSCQMKIMEPEPSGDNTGTIVGVVVGVLLVTVVIVISVFLIRRRRQKSTKQDSFDDLARQNGSRTSHHNHSYEPDAYATEQGKTYENVDDVKPLADDGNVYVNSNDVSNVDDDTRTSTSHDNVYVNAHDVGEDDSANVYKNKVPTCIDISDLATVVKTKMLDKAKIFENEYKSLPYGAIHDHNIGMLNENKMKNRFKSTFPYDHSRVILDKLDNDPHSDYINANYIDSVSAPAEYIATQGPTDKTIDDLWRMIWKLKSGKIVMLTNLMEGTKKKCAKYWPDEGHPMSTKHFEVVLDRERVYAFYVIRDITLMEKKTKSTRQIHQFHYTTWPDHGTPDPNELVVFHRRVKLYKTALTGKMVVHCSAGIGRTGTFIALDALLEQGKVSSKIDIMEYIRTMRKDRVNMVQTSEQYIAIHNLLIEAFAMPDTLISREKYHPTLTLLCGSVPVNQTKLWREYTLTQDLKPTYTQTDCKSAISPSNRDKNRDPNVLPVERFRPYLTSSSPGRTNYINAVIVPSYTSRTGYIVTQTPLKDTVVDLLTMVMDHSCDTIVIIENETISWLPEEGKALSVGSFKLKHEGGSSVLADTDLVDVGISNQDYKYDARIRVFHMKGWNRDVSVPTDSPALLQLLELIDSRRKSNNTKTSVVMCRDGSSQSGLFCCISNARDQMKIDEEVDIFQIARQLLFRRPQFITNYEQYQCCYNMMKDYLDTTDVYMN